MNSHKIADVTRKWTPLMIVGMDPHLGVSVQRNKCIHFAEHLRWQQFVSDRSATTYCKAEV